MFLLVIEAIVCVRYVINRVYAGPRISGVIHILRHLGGVGFFGSAYVLLWRTVGVYDGI